MSDSDLVSVTDLQVSYKSGLRRSSVAAVDGVTFSIRAGMSVGLLGESGSGKSTICNAILGLAPITRGSIVVGGHEVTAIGRGRVRRSPRVVQVVFQNPYRAFDPYMSLGKSLLEPVRVQRAKRGQTAERDGRRLAEPSVRGRLESRLAAVGLGAEVLAVHPGELSGGQLQRLAIVRALMADPVLLICDEPTSSLDASVRGQVLTVLAELRRRGETAMLFVSHEIDVIRLMTDETVVLADGHIVEHGATESVWRHPSHEFTRALITAGHGSQEGS